MPNKTILSEKSVECTCPKYRLVTSSSADGTSGAVPGCEFAPLGPSGTYTDTFCVPHARPSPTLFWNFHVCAPVSPPRLCPPTHFCPSHSLGPSQLVNRPIVLWLICTNSLDGTLTLCYACCEIFCSFNCSYGVLIPQSLQLVLISF